VSNFESTITDRDTEDRRFLPRANPGRRDIDSDTAGGIAGGDAALDEEDEVNPLAYLLLLLFLTIFGMGLIWIGNARFAPLLFNTSAVKEVAAILASGSNFATFDLNIESRTLRHAHIANLRETPDVAVIGASHWQEGHAYLVPGRYFYNAHVHRDYYEDVLAVTEMFVSNNRLPKQLIITIRDNLFTPIGDRTDFLWMAALLDQRAGTERLGLIPAPLTETLPLPLIREGFSLGNLHANIKRWADAPQLPHVTRAEKHRSLDILLSDGSIAWSDEHDALFTRALAKEKALSFAAQRRNDPPRIDPQGVIAIQRVLEFLQDRGVEVFLAHPPFNPIYYDAVQNSPYMDGLAKIESLTRGLADKYGLSIIGSFNPYDLGCGSELYIDAEHSNPTCLQKIFDQYIALDGPRRFPAGSVN